MARRRAPGEGSIRKRKDGRWEAAITVGHTAQGNPKRRFVYGRTRGEVVDKLQQLTVQAATRGLAAPSGITVAEYLAHWLQEKAESCASTTAQNYRWTLERYVLPGIGKRRVQRVTPLEIDALLQDLASGRAAWLRPPADESPAAAARRRRRDPEGKVGPRTVRYVRALLHTAFARAVEWEVLQRNPVLMPKGTRSRKGAAPPRVWSLEEVRSFAQVARGSRYAAAYYLALVEGLRRGELLGLRLSDLDGETGTLRIERQIVVLAGRPAERPPKTDNARRIVHLPPSAIAALIERRGDVEHEQEQAEKAGVWKGGTDPYFFGTHYGTPTNPRSLLRDFRAITLRAGVPPIRFHDLRHTHASLALAQRESPASLAARLGHHSPAFTLEIYSHLVPGQERAPAEAVERLLAVPPEQTN
ncbi:MAG: tyrosine-type recombinase/integrase [Acidobacteriota bacterium]